MNPFEPGSSGTAFRTKYPKCNKTHDSSREMLLDRISALGSEAAHAAETSGVPVAWVFGWAASETGFTSGVATKNNNYFNLTGRTSWGGGACGTSAVGGYACFTSFDQSAVAALTSAKNGLSYGGLSGVSVTSIIASVLGDDPSATVAQVFQTIADAGFDPRGSPTNSGYGDRVSKTIRSYQSAMECMKEHEYI
jgi:hypothetical protein